ncbi:hypothetical protein [Mycolicibacterium sp. NCC-Tsukiji]|uniref:hypothetical protein n=1 Tax=Mycolicibacterium sp. NCC-Tsukiji TaxID=2185272 RepID=UPI000EB94431|nr:hypothetical protein [Mycolicibacterium sp. NCC-Tsukiji]GCA99481.1 hypothetical protein NCCNTM_31160 [Mycolicibacterium sp. NCC-Tsukiji]
MPVKPARATRVAVVGTLRLARAASGRNLVTRAAQPLFLAQVFSSASGALGMVMAASAMLPGQFTTFSLLVLALQFCSGATRSYLFQPALVETRNNPEAHIHVRIALIGALCAGTAFLIAIAVLGIHDRAWLATLSVATLFPVMTEWLRLRGMALDERRSVANGDAIRLVVTPLGSPILWFTTDPKVFYLFVCLTYVSTVAYLAVRLPRVATHLSPRSFRRSASSQLADFVLAQLVSTIPLLVLGGMGHSGFIGGIRMAQSLLGPINLVIWASAMNLMADGATQKSHANPSDLIRQARRLAAILALFCLFTIAVVLVALIATDFSFRGADNHSMVIGVLLAGSYLLTAAWTYPDTIVMRLLGHHSTATWGRAGVVLVTAVGYGLGYLVGGPDMSLIFAFIGSAVANLVAFMLPAAIIYRRYP